MSWIKKLFRKPESGKNLYIDTADTLYPLEGLRVEYRTNVPWALIRNGKNQICGIWLANIEDSHSHELLRMIIIDAEAKGEKIDVESYAAASEGAFHVVPNGFDNLGGYFLIFKNPFL